MRQGLKRVAHRRDDALTGVRWDRLEHLLAAYYREAGYQVKHVGTGATAGRFDGGVDLELRREGRLLLVQVKHWNACQARVTGSGSLIRLAWSMSRTYASKASHLGFNHGAEVVAAPSALLLQVFADRGEE